MSPHDKFGMICLGAALTCLLIPVAAYLCPGAGYLVGVIFLGVAAKIAF